MQDIHYFDDIRPFIPEELPEAFDTLISDPEFVEVISKVIPEIPFEQFVAVMRSCKTSQEFQQRLVYQFVMKIAATASDGLDADFSSLDFSTGYTFISNHRDIVLDSAFLCALLLDHKQDTVEIAIGDNLLIHPWIRNLVRVNRSFIVQRALTMRQMLMASKKMSEYIHYVIQEKRSNVWIAQREGRAKDSNDRTQDSVLKMLCLGGKSGSVIESLKELNIVPLTISYEYDPCDYLKAEEFQYKRDVQGWKKSKQDDLDNMKIGILGQKGHVHYEMATPIDEWLDTLPKDMPRKELFRTVAEHIDKEIHSRYRLYPGNWIAYDEILGTPGAHSDKYTEADKAKFESYIKERISKVRVPNPDVPFLRERLMTMYANPVKNYLATS